MPDITFAADSIDGLIANRLPDWLCRASPAHLRALHQALKRQNTATDQLGAVLNAIPTPQAFASPLLKQALAANTLADIDEQSSQLVISELVIRPPISAGVPPSSYRLIHRSNLLSSALHNFHLRETTPSASRQGWLESADGTPLPLSFEKFAELCRTLDLGGGYQAVLLGLLQPSDQPGDAPNQRKRAVERLFEQSFSAHLEVAVRLAALKGELDERSYLQMLPVISQPAIVPPLPDVSQARQLYLLGKQIRGVVAVEVRPKAGAEVNAVIAWVPGDPHGPTSRYASWQALYDALAGRLRERPYQRFFQRFVSMRDQPVFFTTLNGLLAATAAPASVELDGRNMALELPLFEHLRKQRIDTLIDDARVLAVSTDAEDENDRRTRLRGYLTAGLDLAGLAALFVPVLGEIMLAVNAAQIADEVYEGYEDWRLGDRQGALDHLFGVAESVVLGAVIAKAGQVAVNSLRRVAFVDDLVPICTREGAVKLTGQDLQAYQVDATDLPAGQKTQRDDGWRLNLHEGAYIVNKDASEEAWHIVHPQRAQAHAPRLAHNDSGGWWHELEAPQHWQGAAYLLQRLSSKLAMVSEATADDLLFTTGLSEEQLRGLHVEGASAPARLLDAHARHQAHAARPELKGDAFEAHLRASEASANLDEGVLMRDFPGLTLRAARELLSHTSTEQAATLSGRGRVPLSLAERTRWHLREARLDRACAGLRQPQAVNADTQRLAMGLIEDLAPWPATVRVELRDEALQGPVLIKSSGEQATQVRRIVANAQGYRLLDGPGAASASDGDSLLRALQLSLDAPQRATLGVAGTDERQLRDLLSRTASGDRERIAAVLGMTPIGRGIRLPRRLGDGRLGYPLSGRMGQGRQACRRGIQQIFPTLDDTQLDQYLLPLLNQEVNLWDHYRGLQRQLAALRSNLREWRQQSVNPLHAWRRRKVADALRRCWRRKLVGLDGEYMLRISGEAIDELPRLPASVSFAHVRRLTLRKMNLQRVEPEFLERFPNLIELNLSGNQLEQIPSGLERLTQLRQLDLSANSIVLNNLGQAQLGALTRLHTLDLSHNPLGQPPRVRHLRFMRRVLVRGAGLQSLLDPPAMVPWAGLADFRDNQLRDVRDELRQLGAGLNRVALHDNPLDDDSFSALTSIAGTSAGRRGHGYQHTALSTAVRNDWVGSANQALRTKRENLWDLLQAEPGSEHLFQFLADFRSTHEYVEAPWEYQDRVWDILEACQEHEVLRHFVFQEAGSVRSCEDRLLYILSQLEVGVLAQDAFATGAPSAVESRLVRLGRALSRLDHVDSIALRRFRALEEADRTAAQPPRLPADEYETRLYYRIKLRHRLDLPRQPHRMNFPHTARVTAADISEAEREVLQAEHLNDLVDSLAMRPFWHNYVHTQHTDRFTLLADPVHARLEAEQTLVDSGKITEAEFLTRSGALMAELQNAERQLTRDLAQQACQRWVSIRILDRGVDDSFGNPNGCEIP
ncbi:NEL-type E3 ubiquitin ligase domain-containing protein [Pseudomonas sp. NPDC089996]|uniref:NEL-type E3 ubiquitin ligase domain-containing protein n=1 Tax=Pseudomonas sp. NPDC089996 TaxID=3364474 RepID=UPI0038220FF5